MPLSIPTRKGVTGSLRNYVRDSLPTLDPSTDRRSFIGGLVKSLGSALADLYLAFKRYADREPFPQTATGKFLTAGWWVPIVKLQKNPASPAHGYIVVQGTAGTILPAASEFQGSGITYRSLRAATIVSQPIAADTLTADSGTGLCTYETGEPHNFATGQSVTISGATPSTYNGDFTIVVTSAKEFTYEPDTLPGSAASGSPIATSVFASIEVEATTTGQSTNLDGGGLLSFVDAPDGADDTGYVGFGGIAGGTDIETDDAYRARVLEALGTDFGMFSGGEIEIVAKQIPGVTRVMVRKATLNGTNGVNEGQVKIAFLRDNDADFLPSAQEVADVKDRIVSLIMPAHTAAEDVVVMSPPPLEVDFSFTSITPDTPGMRRAIEASLRQFFREGVQWGELVPEDAYRCAIMAAYDADTRQKLRSFILSSPTGDVDPTDDEYPVLGTVTWG